MADLPVDQAMNTCSPLEKLKGKQAPYQAYKIGCNDQPYVVRASSRTRLRHDQVHGGGR
jgi:hypothetical protein